VAKIRPFIEGKDEAIYVNILNRTMIDYSDFTPITITDALMEEQIASYDSEGRFIAEWDNEPAGYVFAYFNPKRRDHCGYMEGPFVVPSFRRKHIGNALVKTAFENYQKRGINLVEASSRANDSDAQKFLESFDFHLHRVFSRMKRSLDNIPENIGENPAVKIVEGSKRDGDLKIENMILGDALQESYNFRPMTFEEQKYYIVLYRKLEVAYYTFVAYDARNPVGIIVTAIDPKEIERYKKHVAWLAILGVLAEYRRRGIGKALILHAMRFLQKKKVEEAMLGVDDNNVNQAAKFYKNLGFEVALKLNRYIKELI
jgi:ribosomal protein S18 acetylase RimI-like enzyme